MKTLKRYQEKAVDELLLKTKLLLDKNINKKTIVFQSPTGSGKTLMMTEYIEQLIKDLEETDLCFLWVSIGMSNLHIQSYNSLKREFHGFPDVYLLEQEFFGSRETIAKNEIVVVNWEKIRTKDNKTSEWKNILMKDKETINFRELVKNTKEENTKLIMIIDESHSNANSERALELRDEIVNADLTIEMSATPISQGGEYNEKVVVQSNDVIEEGMIKKEIIINEDIDQINDDEITSQELVMQAAFQKREELKQLYQNINVDINPLVLVQLPSSEAGEEKKEFVESFLAEKGITYENKKLALWMSDEENKINQEDWRIKPNDSEVDFLIFKLVVGTGWDCPRASILVRFREIRSIVFEIQTIGRILRMPETKHYEDDNLNKGFVYTNVKSLEVKKETYNPNIIKTIVVKRKDIYEPVKLKSYYRNRVDFGDITFSFYKVLDETFCRYFDINEKIEISYYDKNKKKVSQKINLEKLDNKDEIILNKSIDSMIFDKLPEGKISGEEADLFSEATLMKANLSQEDLFNAFELLIKVNLNGFAYKRSIPAFKQALYRWFKKYLNVKLGGNGIIYIQNIVLNNAGIFSKLFDESIRDYKPFKVEEIKKKIEEIEEWNEEWEIAESRNLNPYTYSKYTYNLSLYDPCYLKLDSNIEKEFIVYLERKSDTIKWFWQNGDEHMALNFGIKYNIKSTFQPDFIVLFKDGRLGIFDTKASGYNEDDNKLKGEALQKYIKEENRKDKNIFGGLVVKEGQHFRINSKENYVSFRDNPNDWGYLEELIK
jgi:type III restriction enzyme